ncbi:MAG: hypothetical protein AAF220_11885, partial [Pseudomonadota bacterium]
MFAIAARTATRMRIINPKPMKSFRAIGKFAKVWNTIQLLVCLDGNAPFDEWTAHVQERRKLERVGFHFAQIWAS